MKNLLLAVSTLILCVAWPSAAQTPPDHDFYDLLREGADRSTRRLYDMMENEDQERYDRAIKNRLEELEQELEDR
jgi:hypothetical protein